MMSLTDNKAYSYTGICHECTKHFMGYKRQQSCHACEYNAVDAKLEELQDAVRAYIQSEDWNGEDFIRPDNAIDILYDVMYKEG